MELDSESKHLEGPASLIPEVKYAGRPGYTPEQLGEFLEAFAKCLSIRKAARSTGLSKSAILARLKPSHPSYDAEFAEVVDYLRLGRIVNLEDKVNDIAMDDGNRSQMRALEVCLKAEYPEKYDRRNADGVYIAKQEVNVTQNVNNFLSKWGGKVPGLPEPEVVDAEVVDDPANPA